MRNPTSRHDVFVHDRKRRRTRDTSLPTKPEPLTLVRRGPLDKPIDLTRDDAELVSHSSMTADDSEDSLDIGAAERSKARIASDGRTTRRLKAGHRGGESSKAVNSDSETGPIEGSSSRPKREGKVQSMVQSIERNGVGPRPAKLRLHPDNPLNSLPVSRKPKVHILLKGKVGWLIHGLLEKAQLRSRVHDFYTWTERQEESHTWLTPLRLGARHRTPPGTAQAFLKLGNGARQTDP